MKGSCLCRSIQYEIKKLNSPIEHCSCITCRKAHSAAFNTSANVKLEDFKWIKGENLLSEYESSPGKRRKFCSLCGSQILAKYDAKPY
ncbi:GFA family protein, partial [bacterium]|nr:GFA family protein [bacterium]